MRDRSDASRPSSHSEPLEPPDRRPGLFGAQVRTWARTSPVAGSVTGMRPSRSVAMMKHCRRSSPPSQSDAHTFRLVFPVAPAPFDGDEGFHAAYLAGPGAFARLMPPQSTSTNSAAMSDALTGPSGWCQRRPVMLRRRRRRSSAHPSPLRSCSGRCLDHGAQRLVDFTLRRGTWWRASADRPVRSADDAAPEVPMMTSA